MAARGSGRRGIQSITGRASRSGSEIDAGAQAFYELSRRLKEVGGTGRGSLRSEMTKALKQAAKPLPQAVRAAALEKLPKAGGLNKRVAKRTPKVVTRTGATTAGVRIQEKKTDPRMNAQGRIYHPVFGRPGSDAVQIQSGVKGYFDDTLQEKAPEVRGAVVEVLEDFARRLVQGL